MFPAASPAELRHCLAVASGDITEAAQLALHRQEAGQSIASNLTFVTVSIILSNFLEIFLKHRVVCFFFCYQNKIKV